MDEEREIVNLDEMKNRRNIEVQEDSQEQGLRLLKILFRGAKCFLEGVQFFDLKGLRGKKLTFKNDCYF